MEYVIESTGLFVEAEKVRLGLGMLPNTGGPSIFNSWKGSWEREVMRLESKEVR